MNLLDYIGREDEIEHIPSGEAVRAIISFPDNPYHDRVTVVFGDGVSGRYSLEGNPHKGTACFRLKPKPKQTWYKLAWSESIDGTKRQEHFLWHKSERGALECRWSGDTGPVITRTDWA